MLWVTKMLGRVCHGSIERISMMLVVEYLLGGALSTRSEKEHWRCWARTIDCRAHGFHHEITMLPPVVLVDLFRNVAKPSLG